MTLPNSDRYGSWLGLIDHLDRNRCQIYGHIFTLIIAINIVRWKIIINEWTKDEWFGALRCVCNLETSEKAHDRHDQTGFLHRFNFCFIDELIEWQRAVGPNCFKLECLGMGAVAVDVSSLSKGMLYKKNLLSLFRVPLKQPIKVINQSISFAALQFIIQIIGMSVSGIFFLWC